MLRIPGFIDIGTDISGGSWRPISAAALRGGYTSLLAAPVAEKVYTEKADVLAALDEPSRSAACDYAKLALITPEKTHSLLATFRPHFSSCALALIITAPIRELAPMQTLNTDDHSSGFSMLSNR